MTMLWLTLVFVFAMSLMARYFAAPAVVEAAYIQPNKILAAIAGFSLALVAGLRNNIGDTFFYMHSYKVNDFSWQAVIQGKDLGFNILQILLKEISDDPQILVLSTALVTNLLIVIVLYKYTRLYELSLFVYITSGAFIVSMNGIRQFLAAAIVFAATKSLVEGKWKTYMLVVLFASLLHQSALIMLPLYFIVRRKAWTGITFAFLLLAVLIVMGFSYFSDILFAALKDTQYGEYKTFNEGGASIIRVLVYAVPLIIVYFGRNKLKEIFPDSDIFVNISILGLVLLIISTQNWIFARMSIYFSLYHLVLLGWLVKLFRPKDQKLVYIAIIFFYLCYFYFENVITLGLQYRSDYLSWFN